MQRSAHSRWINCSAAFLAVLAISACADEPLAPEATAPEPAFSHAGGHQGVKGGPPVSITVTKQPEIVPNDFLPGSCILRYGFDYEGKGPERAVDWRTTVIGGDYDGFEVGGSINPTTIGGKLPPVVIGEVSFGHLDNGDVFTALRIRVQDAVTKEVYGETLTEGGTFSCPT